MDSTNVLAQYLQQQNTLLQQQNQLLERLVNVMDQGVIGLCDPPFPSYIYVGLEGNSLWYFFDLETKEKMLIEKRAITGYLQDIRIRTVKTVLKFEIVLQAEQPYVIRSGEDTTFSRGFLLALNTLDPTEINKKITIVVQPPDQSDKKSVFCRLYVGNDNKFAKWNADIKIADLVNIVRKRLGLGLGRQDDFQHHQDEPAPVPAPTKRTENTVTAPIERKNLPIEQRGNNADSWKNWKSLDDGIQWCMNTIGCSKTEAEKIYAETPRGEQGKKGKNFVMKVLTMPQAF